MPSDILTPTTAQHTQVICNTDLISKTSTRVEPRHKKALNTITAALHTGNNSLPTHPWQTTRQLPQSHREIHQTPMEHIMEHNPPPNKGPLEKAFGKELPCSKRPLTECLHSDYNSHRQGDTWTGEAPDLAEGQTCHICNMELPTQEDMIDRCWICMTAASHILCTHDPNTLPGA